MNILNLSSDYSRQRLYKNLAENIADQGDVRQDIFVPVRTEKEVGRNRPERSSINIVYRHILTPRDRFMYKAKIRKIYAEVKRYFEASTYDVVHAHFLFSDGGVAYYLWKDYKIPYTVAVRNTDINFFLRYAVHLKGFGARILLNAERIILLSPAYKDILLRHFNKTIINQIRHKIEVVPNAIDDFWFENPGPAKEKASAVMTLLYVGDFSRNKNVPFLIKAKQKYFPEANLNIVGSTGADEDEITALANSDDRIFLHGRISDNVVLREYYREADILCIPSRYETFGLSYIEALSQATPIIYTRGQGVDGYFDKPVGVALPYGDSPQFEFAVKEILNNYRYYSTNALESINQFKWSTISKQYLKIYEECRSKN